MTVYRQSQVAPGDVELRPRRSLEVRGSPELQNGGLRDLEEAWDDFLVEAFSCQVCSFFVLLGRVQVVAGSLRLRPRRSLEARGSPELQNGGLRPLEEAWDDFLLEAFSCQVWSFSVLLGRLQVAHGWRLRQEAESWRLAAGGWRLVAGGLVWRFEA